MNRTLTFNFTASVDDCATCFISVAIVVAAVIVALLLLILSLPLLLAVRPVWLTFQCYNNFSAVTVFTVFYSIIIDNGQLLLLKSYPNWPYVSVCFGI